MKYPRRRQYKYAKSPYRIRNWAEYEVDLQRRGDLTVWLSNDVLDAWRAPPSGKPGGQRTYADIAIEAALTIRMVFHLPLRQTEGFLAFPCPHARGGDPCSGPHDSVPAAQEARRDPVPPARDRSTDPSAHR